MGFSRRRKYNERREIDESVTDQERRRLVQQVMYGGNPEHKRSPGDFGLSPPCMPRRDKEKCDDFGVNSRREALKLLREGVRKGLISKQRPAPFRRTFGS